ncbi:MAG: sulfate ABC transporter permease subunit [Brevefilum sp.]|nr:sulfate ABC transporter permease subunit [Brevefilum sp.]
MNLDKKGLGGWFLIVVMVIYLGILIVGPIIALMTGAFQNGLMPAVRSISSAVFSQALALTMQIAILVVIIQLLVGTMIAWMLIRHEFPGKGILNGLIDVPFAISPVVVGYMLLLLFGRNSLIYPVLDRFNYRIVFATPGMFLATLFVCFPFMIREMVPVIQNLDRGQEYAAATLGASRWTSFWRIIFPQLKSGLIYGMTLTLARAIGEFGAVLVVGGGVQGRTETATLFIFRSMEERRYIEAYSAALLLGAFSVLIVFVADWLKRSHEKKRLVLSVDGGKP